MCLRKLKKFSSGFLVLYIFFMFYVVNNLSRFINREAAQNLDIDEAEKKQDHSKITAVLTFPYLHQLSSSQTDYNDFSSKQKDQRMDEYVSSLQSTLLHDKIKSIHILYDNELLPEFIKARIFQNSEKLKFFKTDHPRKAISIFRHVFNELNGELVMVIQADTYPGDGFELIQKKVMLEQRLMYALSRNGRLEDSCDLTGEFCEIKPYVGSHDAYIFVPIGKLSNKVKKVLDSKTSDWGIDKLIVWVFQNMLNYRVLNPCYVVHIYHRHCSFIRNTQRGFANNDNTTGWAYPTDKLI